jgi:hypothetical protein
MAYAVSALGSLVLDVSPNTLRGRFLDDGGQVRDDFAIVKGVVSTPSGPELSLALAGGNPARGTVAFVAQGGERLSIVDAAGRRVRGLIDENRVAGAHSAAWDGRGDDGRAVAAGLYFAVLDGPGARSVTRLVRIGH